MSSYDISAVKEKIRQLTQATGGGGKKEQITMSWWKPTVGKNEIRFLPYTNKDGQPFEEIGYYDSRQLSEKRLVAPCQWGMDDPIHELVEDLRPNRSNDATWKLMQQLRIKESYYAPVLVRGQEDKGVQIWELGPRVLKDIYSTLANPDYADEDLFDPENGYDFLIDVSLTGKKYNGFDVKDYNVSVRRKSTKLAKTKAAQDKLIDSIPDIEGYFKQWCKGEDAMKEVITNFLSNAEQASTSDEGTEHTADVDDSTRDEEAKSKIDEAFKDL